MSCLDLYTWVGSSVYEWSDENYIQWGICFGDDLLPLRQVWMDQFYAYGVTSSGLDIIDLVTENIVAFTYEEEGFTTIWGSDTVIYLGTGLEGIKYIEKSTIVGNESSPTDLTSFVNNYNFYYNAGSENIKYIHGYKDTLVIVTPNGVDVINNGPNGYKSSVVNTNVIKCFITSNKEVYYITQELTTNKIQKMNSCLCDWTTADVVYTNDGTVISEHAVITDIFVTSNTSISGVNNTLFVATSSGAQVVDEEILEYDNYTTSLAGTSFGLTGIWADSSSSRINGRMYTISSGIGAALSVMNLNSGTLYDKYTLVEMGLSNEFLASENPIDIVAGDN